ncbi:MAG: type II toxin-antitoxin system prevent-host-death family antitoxin [Prevotellaceae bacterium]|jgi:antitoxin YefM|nr:type II toxin-antitoxin system prevent-host-death family antitoxin [Prevotellaceae bacterium]
MRTANYTELRSNLKGYIDSVVENTDTLLVNRGGGTGVVIMSLDEYNAIKETEYIMRSQAMMDIIRKGEQEIKEGKGIEFDLSAIS